MDLIKYYIRWGDKVVHANAVSLERKMNKMPLFGGWSTMTHVGVEWMYNLNIEADHLELNKLMAYGSTNDFVFYVKYQEMNNDITVKIESNNIKEMELTASHNGISHVKLNLCHMEVKAREIGLNREL